MTKQSHTVFKCNICNGVLGSRSTCTPDVVLSVGYDSGMKVVDPDEADCHICRECVEDLLELDPLSIMRQHDEDGE